MIQILSLVNEFVLPPGSNPGKRRGMIIQETMRSPIFNWLTQVGRMAAQRFNQYPDEEWLGEETAEETATSNQL